MAERGLLAWAWQLRLAVAGAVPCSPGCLRTSQSASILPGVRHLGTSPCSTSHLAWLWCGPLRASVSPSFNCTKRFPSPCSPLLGLLWFPVPWLHVCLLPAMTCPQQGKLRGALPTYPVYSWLVWCGSCAEKGLIPPDIHILLLDDKLQCLKTVLGVPITVTAGLWPTASVRASPVLEQ